ncbi:Do/DeqQ family serine protease [Marinitoga hydrogenitolerans DSM 16785]|uniref:Do/DeqQ family serine protease n=1 Tax=Marinitoga hydrogenitolerans (strain DSM 16785 / JCM 12826 / AT1271) TaxID=1122195 RepID=A0A1M4URN3_MARH1|nr:Do family serine endopeptidase [Marinitoga hydrogenitolerans]SHE59376.1 Do/DeqQ family serine protease [Marinitoga hydrogenitolerans DSM 16785]
MKKIVIAMTLLLAVVSTFAFVNPDYVSPVVNVVNEAAPAVVNIEAVGHRQASIDPFFEDFYKRFFGESPWTQDREFKALGTGFIFDKRGYILTNYHVVENADEITITTLKGKKYKAKYVGGDKDLDIAVLQVKTKDELPVIELGNSDDIQIGEWAIAIGNPLGFKHTVTLGVVSAVHRKIPKPDGNGYYADLIQTDAAINPGNSGGPLLNIHAQVIGINTAIINPSEGQNLGFAIPINFAKRFAESLINTGKVSKAYLGVYIQNVTETLAKTFGLKVTKGAFVSDIEKGSPAEKAGIKPGDVIIKIDNKEINSADELVYIVKTYPAGEKIKVVVNRKGKEITYEIVLAEREEFAKATNEYYLGLKVRDLTPEDLNELRLPKGMYGVMVEDVKDGSDAQYVNIKKGDIIMEMYVNGKGAKLETIKDFQKLSSKIKKGDYIGFIVFRNGYRMSVYFTYSGN